MGTPYFTTQASLWMPVNFLTEPLSPAAGLEPLPADGQCSPTNYTPAFIPGTPGNPNTYCCPCVAHKIAWGCACYVCGYSWWASEKNISFAKNTGDMCGGDLETILRRQSHCYPSTSFLERHGEWNRNICLRFVLLISVTAKGYSLLGCDIVYSVRQITTFWITWSLWDLWFPLQFPLQFYNWV